MGSGRASHNDKAAKAAARAASGDRGFGTALSESLLFAAGAKRLSSDASKATRAAGQAPSKSAAHLAVKVLARSFCCSVALY